MKKNSKIKENIKKFKELWAIPRYRALIKLSLYAVMFIILIVMANLSQSISSEDQKENKENTFTQIMNSIDLNNVEIKYIIKHLDNVYTIEGKIDNNILSGYIENNGIIRKVIVKENYIYNILNDVEILDEELNTILIKEFLIPSKIIEFTTNETAYIEKLENETNYTYQINHNEKNYEIILTTDFQLKRIKIINENIEYNLELIFDKNE